MKKLLLKFVFLLLLAAFTSCAAVKPYQRAHLNDRDMQFGKSISENFQQSVHVNREASMGGTSGKASGGCGCN